MPPSGPDRPWLLERLAAYAPADAGDRARHARLTAFVRGHADCHSRARSDGHLVASAWLVDLDGGRVLLHHHARLGRWLQFGGHVDPGDANVLEAARRELMEESGLAAEPVSGRVFDLDVHEIPATAAEPAHLHYDVRFAFRAPAGAVPAASAESRALRWVPLAEVAALTAEASVLRMVARTADLPS